VVACSRRRNAFSIEAATGLPFVAPIMRVTTLPNAFVPVRSQWRSMSVPPSWGCRVAETELPGVQKLLSTTVQRMVSGSLQS
jgi:hypothetical protein